jgi:hypothetical protein
MVVGCACPPGSTSVGTLSAALEGSLDVFIPTMASQGKVDQTEDRLGVLGRRVVVPEEAGIWRDSQPAIAQHYEAAKCGNGIGVEMN